MECSRSCRFSPLDFLAAIRHVLLKSIERSLDQLLLARRISFLAQIRPIFPVRVGATDDRMPLLAIRPSTRIVETKGARSDVAIEQQVGAKFICRRTKQQITRRFRNLDPRLDRHVNLRAAVIEPHTASLLDKLRIKMLFTDQFENRRT